MPASMHIQRRSNATVAFRILSVESTHSKIAEAGTMAPAASCVRSPKQRSLFMQASTPVYFPTIRTTTGFVAN